MQADEKDRTCQLVDFLNAWTLAVTTRETTRCSAWSATREPTGAATSCTINFHHDGARDTLVSLPRLHTKIDVLGDAFQLLLL